jgi:hypothetical protein
MKPCIGSLPCDVSEERTTSSCVYIAVVSHIISSSLDAFKVTNITKDGLEHAIM